jgi:hypothetical protein
MQQPGYERVQSPHTETQSRMSRKDHKRVNDVGGIDLVYRQDGSYSWQATVALIYAANSE